MMGSAITLMQLEQALNNFENTMVGKDGKLAVDDSFLKIFDGLMKRLSDAREMAEGMKKS